MKQCGIYNIVNIVKENYPEAECFNTGFIDEACCIYKNGFLIKEDAISGLFSCEEFAWRDAFEKMYK